MDVRKTKSGWVLDITSRRDDCLEAGGVCGRVVLYSRETLAKLGIDYDADPEGAWNEGATYAEYLHRMVQPDRVLKAGVEIQ